MEIESFALCVVCAMGLVATGYVGYMFYDEMSLRVCERLVDARLELVDWQATHKNLRVCDCQYAWSIVLKAIGLYDRAINLDHAYHIEGYRERLVSLLSPPDP